MLPTSLPGGNPSGMTAARPTPPPAPRRARFGMGAASGGKKKREAPPPPPTWSPTPGRAAPPRRAGPPPRAGPATTRANQPPAALGSARVKLTPAASFEQPLALAVHPGDNAIYIAE